jgi:hypothetical protein
MSIRDILITGKAAKLPGDLREHTDDVRQIGRKAELRARGRVRKRRGEMNSTELAFSRELQTMQSVGEITWFGFECITFRLADRTTYTPDFLVLFSTGYLWAIDVKGATKTKGGKHKAFSEEDARVKIKLVAELFPLHFAVAYRLPQKAGGAWKIDEV